MNLQLDWGLGLANSDKHNKQEAQKLWSCVYIYRSTVHSLLHKDFSLGDDPPAPIGQQIRSRNDLLKLRQIYDLNFCLRTIKLDWIMEITKGKVERLKISLNILRPLISSQCNISTHLSLFSFLFFFGRKEEGRDFETKSFYWGYICIFYEK